MTKKYTPSPDCYAAANAASGEKLTKDEIDAAFQRVSDYKQRLQATGQIDGIEGKLRSFAEREAERTKIAAAMQKRHAALNILVRDRLDQQIDGFIRDGLSPRKALLAVIEGTQKGVEGGRNSVAALRSAYEASYLGGLFAELQANRPHLVHSLHDPKMDADILREMSELREGGKPGITGNDDAKYVANVFASYAELSRTDLNNRGASIGKLDGWSGAQSHDDIKMIAAGKDAWVSSVLPKLDIDRTFPDLNDTAQVSEVLSDIYDTIISGVSNKVGAREKGQRVNPANLAKSLGKSRVLHFEDAEAVLSYRNEFGYGNTVSGIFSHLKNAARLAANMQVFGPNPEVMIGSIVDGLRRRVRDNVALSPEEKSIQSRGLRIDAGAIRQAMDISSGLASRPVNVTAANIGADTRAVQSMAKLGFAIYSSITDTVTPAIASQFRGSGFMRGFVAQLDGIRKGRPKGEVAEVSYLLGEGFDGILGYVSSASAAVDGPLGYTSSLQEAYFRWNAQTWWTDVQRASAGRMISAEMGMRAKSAYDALPGNYRHVLSVHNIDATKWEAIRKAGSREVEGKAYITPDLIRNLEDADVEPLVANRLEGKNEEQRGEIIERARRDLELSVLSFFADETNYGIIETDNRSRRTTTLGLRPGTTAGEAIRFIAQFKGFPTAFTQRVVGRALFGHRSDATFAEKAKHMGTLIAGMTMAGYVSMTLKDIAKGNWPPRDPTDLKTWGAAFMQGGAAGVYGDYLFAKTNRFGGGLLETLAGPSIGAIADLGELYLKARDGSLSSEEEVRMADFLDFGVQNTPFANLFYIRPALDYLFLNSMREAASPGYMRRQEKRRMKDYGQSNFLQGRAF